MSVISPMTKRLHPIFEEDASALTNFPMTPPTYQAGGIK